MRLLVRGLLSRGHGRGIRKRRAAAAVCTHCGENYQPQLQWETTTKDDSVSADNCLPVTKKGSVDGISGLEEPLHDLILKADIISEGNCTPAPMMDWTDVKSGVKESLTDQERKGRSSFSDESSYSSLDLGMYYEDGMPVVDLTDPNGKVKGKSSFLEESSYKSMDGMSEVQSLPEPKRKHYGVLMKEDKWKYSKGVDYYAYCKARKVDVITFLEDVLGLGAGCGWRLYCPIVIQPNYFCCRLSKTERELMEGHDEVESVERYSAKIVYDC